MYNVQTLYMYRAMYSDVLLYSDCINRVQAAWRNTVFLNEMPAIVKHWFGTLKSPDFRTPRSTNHFKAKRVTAVKKGFSTWPSEACSAAHARVRHARGIRRAVSYEFDHGQSTCLDDRLQHDRSLLDQGFGQVRPRTHI
jgi:hypothetical protein